MAPIRWPFIVIIILIIIIIIIIMYGLTLDYNNIQRTKRYIIVMCYVCLWLGSHSWDHLWIIYTICRSYPDNIHHNHHPLHHMNKFNHMIAVIIVGCSQWKLEILNWRIQFSWRNHHFPSCASGFPKTIPLAVGEVECSVSWLLFLPGKIYLDISRSRYILIMIIYVGLKTPH